VGIGTTDPLFTLDVSGNIRTTGGIRNTAGTVSAPSYTFFNDLSMGLYDPTSNELGITTAGVERARVDLSGLRMMNGTFRNLSGTVSAPSYTFFNDLSMGLYDPSSNVLGFVTSGVERMRIASNGNVGIGTANPGFPLEISSTVLAGTANSLFLRNSATADVSNNVRILFGPSAQSGTGQAYIESGFDLSTTNGPGYLALGTYTAGAASIAERMRIKSNGNVGIGMSNPNSLLNILGTESPCNSTQIGVPTSDTLFSVVSRCAYSSTDRVMMEIGARDRAAGNANTPYKYRFGFSNTASPTSGGAFIIQAVMPTDGLYNTDVVVERMRISPGGNVGIGTTNPVNLLDISGTSGGTLSTIALRGGSTSTYTGIDFFTSANSYVGSISYGNSAVGISSAQNNFMFYYGNRSLVFLGSNANEYMRITGTGNVGIGRTSPGVALDISGACRTSLGFNATTAYTIGNIRLTAGGLDNIAQFDPIVFGIGNPVAEAMRITADARLCINTASQPANYYLFVNGAAGGVGGYTNTSDSRIKKNIRDLSDNECLDILRLIEPKTYNYIDPTRGDETVYGFIAQQIHQVLPYATPIGTFPVPNILMTGDLSDNVVTLPTPIFDTFDVSLSIGFGSNGSFTRIVQPLTSNSFRLLEPLPDGNTSNVFVYGNVVNDFHMLQKDAIFTVNVAATQELDRQLQAAKGKIQQLEDTLSNVITRLSALEQPA
jgi:hypothetical protein